MGRRSTSQHGFKARTAPSAFSPAAVRRRSPWACARNTGASMCATCCAAWTPTAADFVLDPITARQFIDRGGFDTKEKLATGFTKRADAGERVLGLPTDPKLRLSARDLGEEPYASSGGRAGRNGPHVQSARRSTSSSSAAKRTATGASWMRYARTMSVDEWR